MEVISLLKKALDMEASDIHLSVGAPPLFRVNGTLICNEPGLEPGRSLSPADTLVALQTLMTSEQYELWEQKGEMEFSFSLPSVGRFRISAYRQRGCVSLAIRPVPYIIPSLESLNLPPVVAGLTEKKQGLVLVAGPTGNGKSTTLAALINKINQERACHIITIENSIEYLHHHQKSLVNQREVGGDTRDTAGALRACLRQDPDVIMLGEMADYDTIATALTAADTGQLVFAALHTGNVIQSIEWIIDMFPPEQKEQAKVKLSAVLQGIVAQRLIPSEDSRVLASEILIGIPAVRSLIRDGKYNQLAAIMQTGSRWGMQTMDMALKELVQTGKISLETALKYCTDKESFNKSMV